MAQELKRRIGLGLLIAYGVGVMVGAGIYVLVGAVAGAAGIWAPLAFVLAGLVATPTALSYAEFTTRLPEAAGEAAFVAKGLRSEALGVIVGLAIVVAGTVSAAAVLRGGSGYLAATLPWPRDLTILIMGALLVAVAVIGVLESLALAALFTAVELAGLVLVVWAGFAAAPSPDLSQMALSQLSDHSALLAGGIGAGAVLAFFAFIGFEDIVNMAEEVANPERNLPRAILWSLLITSVIYALVAYAAVRAVPLAELSGSEQPLALVWQAGLGGSAAFLSLIAGAAALNGVLAQIVMAARVLFGLGRRNASLATFHRAHPRFGTPVRATLLVGVTVILTAWWLPVATLAEVTSQVLLSVFVVVNLALILLKRRTPQAPFRVPMAVPVFGLLAALAALAMSFGAI